MRISAVIWALLLSVAMTSIVKAQSSGGLGIEVQTVTEKLVAEKNLAIDVGVYVVEVKPESPATEIKVGDVITRLNGKPIIDKQQFEALLAPLKSGDKVQLGRSRSGEVGKTVEVALAAPPQPAVPMPASSPLVMLDTGGHMALVRGLAFTPDGRQIVSAGDDKVVRVWDSETGRTVRTIRGEIGPGNEGKIFTLALSPDGRWLAVAGWLTEKGETGHYIRIFDFLCGRVAALLRGHTDVITSVAFSPDSRRLASGSHDNNTIVWDLGNQPEQSALTPRMLHRLTGDDSSAVYAVRFSPDGSKVIMARYDGTMMLWQLDDIARLSFRVKAHNDRIRALAIRESDGLIATGDHSGTIKLWDSSGKLLRALPRQDSGVGSLAFSPDGAKLLSTCATVCFKANAHVYDVAGAEDPISYTGHDNIVLAADISPDGRWAATAGGGNNEIHIWDLATGARREKSGGGSLTLAGTGGPGWAVGFSRDGGRIAWGGTYKFTNDNNRGPLEYQLRLTAAGSSLGRPEPIAAASDNQGQFLRALTSLGPLSITHRKGGNYGYDAAVLDIRRNGDLVASIERGFADGLVHRAYTLTVDGRTIISGGSFGRLSAYDVNGRSLGDFVGHTGDVWAVAPSPDGRFLVSGGYDQTIRLWNVATRELLVTLFYGRDDEWVLWTPQGFYTGSPGGGRLLGWQLNNGAINAADFVTGEQFRRDLDRTDIISRIVDRSVELGSSEAAVREAFPQGFSLAKLLVHRPPSVCIVTPSLNPRKRSKAFGGRTMIVVHLKLSELPVTAIEIYVGGQKVPERRVALPENAPKPPSGYEARAYDVPLHKGENRIAVVAINAIASTPLEDNLVTVSHTGEGALDTYGTLYIVAVGVDRYPGLGTTCGLFRNRPCHLSFGSADARAFAETAAKEMGPLHEKVVTRLLVNGGKPDSDPTKANIEAAMKAIQSAGPTDTVAVLLAGHGEQGAVASGTAGRYFFLPTDIAGRTIDDAGRGENLLDWSAIQDAVTASTARKLLFVDACQAGQAQAGQAYNPKLLGDARAARFTVFSATSPDELAEENRSLGHGIFTWALIEGLSGDKAMDPRERTIRASSLGTFVEREVAYRTQGRQRPEAYTPGSLVLVRR